MSYGDRLADLGPAFAHEEAEKDRRREYARKHPFKPCPACGWSYDRDTILAYQLGETYLDLNPTHNCNFDPFWDALVGLTRG